MNRESMASLKYDKRLANRRGWVSKKDLDAELSALPDVSDKIAPPESDEPKPVAAPAAEAPAFGAAPTSDSEPPTFG